MSTTPQGDNDPATTRSPVTSLSDALTDAEESDANRAPGNTTPSRNKRIKVETSGGLGDETLATVPVSPIAGAHEEEHAHDALNGDGMSDVSSDTDGEIPDSPANTRFDDDDFLEQVSSCAWEGCEAGDQGNMDKLVEHIHNEHIEGRQRKYTCEWIGCSRKSLGHASGYALKAHMRSHTREKPFYCYLPECDRAFTRSDALAKHMRTVHQTEDLRPSDPVPKSQQSAGPQGRKLKIILKTPASMLGLDEPNMDDINPFEDIENMGSDHFTPLSEEDFTRAELDMPLEKLFRRCRVQLRVSEQESETLGKEIAAMEAMYKQEWLDKEVLLSQVIQSEKTWHERRQIVLAEIAKIEEETKRAIELAKTEGVEKALEITKAESSKRKAAALEMELDASPEAATSFV